MMEHENGALSVTMAAAHAYLLFFAWNLAALLPYISSHGVFTLCVNTT